MKNKVICIIDDDPIYQLLINKIIALSETEYDVISFKNGKEATYLVEGSAGTGKTILASFLVKYLADQKETKDLKVGLVIAMTPLRKTLQKVFAKIPGLDE